MEEMKDMDNKEKISALFDGELSDVDTSEALNELQKTSNELQ